MLADDSPTFDALQPEIVRLVAAALDELVATRRREGEKLAEMIRGRIAHMRALVAKVQPRVPAPVAEYQEKLAARLRDAAATLDDDRIRLEVGLFAQRVDVAEDSLACPPTSTRSSASSRPVAPAASAWTS